MDGQDLHQHTARAHCDKRRLREKDASSEVQLAGHCGLESLGQQGQGNGGFWRRRVPEHDLRERGPGVHPGHSAGWTSL